MNIADSVLPEIFDDIVLGRNVKRSLHHLVYEEIPYIELFKTRLRYNRYWPTNVNDVHVNPGFRIPAFYIENYTAIFGYVFWEVFNKRKMHKLWGSTIKNEFGDWKYIISGQQNKMIWANLHLKEEIDLPFFF